MESGKIGLETGITSPNLPGYNSNIVEISSIKYGLFKNMDIGLDVPYQSFKPAGAAGVSGLGDLSVKTKINLLPVSETSMGVSLVAGAKLNNGDQGRGLGTGAVDYSLNSIITRDLAGLCLHFNLGYAFIGQTAGQTLRNVASYGCAFEAPLIAGVKLLGEIYGSTNPDPTASINPLTATLAANKEIFSGLTADTGLSIGLNDAAPRNIIMVGLTGAF